MLEGKAQQDVTNVLQVPDYLLNAAHQEKDRIKEGTRASG